MSKRQLTVRQQQRREIALLRTRYNIRPVELHAMPRWWMERVCWVTTGWGCNAACTGMWDIGHDLPFQMFDHWGRSANSRDERTCWNDGPKVFVTEPYQSYSDSVVWGWVASVAETLGVHFRILPATESWWYPEHTIRIEFVPCIHAPICRRCKTREEMRDASRERRRKNQQRTRRR